MARILIIDDDTLICQSLSLVARQKNHEATSSHTLADGLEKAATEPFDIIFLDVNLPDGNGLELLSKLPKMKSAPEIIIMTGYGDPNGAELALTCGAWDYLEKGASVREISVSLSRALQYREQKLSGSNPLNDMTVNRDGIIGNSASLKACLDLVAQSAISDASVLITGETGTGKELFARAVHQNSLRKNRKFVVVDCAALPENLVEGMLFGHEKGAYTNADHAREGLISQANGGTLFLDEIGEMPLSLQKVFLRVLQEHRFLPLGSNREVQSDFRLVAATNRNLDEMVKNGQFRSDLLFRISTFVISLPSFRERAEDITELARYHADQICQRYGTPCKEFSPDFLNMLKAYNWPGNIRELVNTLERTIAAARFERILFPKHLPVQLRIAVTKTTLKRETPSQQPAERGETSHLPQLHELRDSIYANAEKKYLHDLMALTGNNIAEACRVSGLSSSRFYALLKKQGIQLQH